MPEKGSERMEKNEEGVIRNRLTESVYTTHDFYYDLPEELIAQTPLAHRADSRLMVVDRGAGTLAHRRFFEIGDYLRPEDILVVNSSRVIPARLLGVNEAGSPMEFLLLRERGALYETLVRPGRRAKCGAEFLFGGILRGRVEEVLPDGNRLVSFRYPSEYRTLYEVLDRVGQMPLPPYITEKLEEKDRYQTVYAKERGSAAAPTAGLHFTQELLSSIKKKGVGYAEVTLHVGLGTFRPVKEEKLEEHEMHTEHFSITPEAADEINHRRAAGGRVIAVGTTSCRVLESVADENGIIRPTEGETGIFIYPGYKFRAVDALITNFHLPESTLIMLVSAFASRDGILNAYETAVKERYRFFSFGDSMFIQ